VERGSVGRARRVLIVCGTGIATSTVVAQKVKEYCEAQGIEVVVDQGKVMDILRGADDYDLVVSTTQVPSSVSVPSVNGLPFLTGVGVDQTLEEIKQMLRAQT
jgi:PTS system galactitol-specific IIB component